VVLHHVRLQDLKGERVNDEGTTRRVLLAAVGTAGAAGVCAALTGCAAYGEGNDPAPAPAAPKPAGGSQPAGSQPAGSAPGGSPAPAANADALAKTADIPVGGGKIFADQKIVVTQPKKGVFKAFSNVCTHQGCPVKEIANGTINCPCHGSEFAIADGAVVAGPAPKPLPAKSIKVSGGSITTA
jgi:Rieske Fe-S protein